ncbi:MAG: 50S ribosomal protein L31 [Acidimicrobiales bacterium]
MRADIHPEYIEASVRCSCGNTFTTRSTQASLTSELCNECHPFYTGKQKLVDTGGRIDRFERRYGKRRKSEGGSDAPEAASEPSEPSES